MWLQTCANRAFPQKIALGAFGDIGWELSYVKHSWFAGTDVAKEAADIVLLDKDLGKLSVGIRLGRITYGNTIKYIKFAASSSFGNTFSIVAAAAWLPFNPLAPIQILVLNLLYNISQFAIPW